MSNHFTTRITLLIIHSKPLPDLTDLAAQRIYTLDGVEDVTASLESPAEVPHMPLKADKYLEGMWTCLCGGRNLGTRQDCHRCGTAREAST